MVPSLRNKVFARAFYKKLVGVRGQRPCDTQQKHYINRLRLIVVSMLSHVSARAQHSAPRKQVAGSFSISSRKISQALSMCWSYHFTPNQSAKGNVLFSAQNRFYPHCPREYRCAPFFESLILKTGAKLSLVKNHPPDNFWGCFLLTIGFREPFLLQKGSRALPMSAWTIKSFAFCGRRPKVLPLESANFCVQKFDKKLYF